MACTQAAPFSPPNALHGCVLNSYEHLKELDRLLLEHRRLWQPQPFKQARPPWCEEQPELCQRLLNLSDDELAELTRDSDALLALLTVYYPSLIQLKALTVLPDLKKTELLELGSRFDAGIPGRKWQQIRAFAAGVGAVSQPVTEWCGGKGHLGRLLSAQWQQPVETLELIESLCEAGTAMAKRVGVTQKFRRVDVLAVPYAPLKPGRHAVALHACGGLHRKLVERAVAEKLPALDIAPCCYHLHGDGHYRPFNDELRLRLSRDDMRIAVTETVTAVGREVRLRDREMAWKLGYDELRRQLVGEDDYRPIKPIDKKWLKLGFEAFCRKLAKREGDALPAVIDWQRYEENGWRRQRETMRLSLVRHAFRRAIELWLVLDIAVYLQLHGYELRLGTFCREELTPRNILISARSE